MNRNNLTAKERRLVINAIAGTAFTIFKVFKHCQSKDFRTQYQIAVEALCLTTEALVGDAGGREEGIQRLADAMEPAAQISAPSPIAIARN